MATVTRYVNTASTAGGDGTTNGTAGATRAYASLNEWEAAEQTDLVTDTDIAQVICSGAQDSTNTTIVGWTTGASNYIEIKTTTDKHAGVFDAAKYFLDGGTGLGNSLNINEDFVRVLDLQFRRNATPTSGSARASINISGVGAGVIAIEGNILKNISTNTGITTGILVADSSPDYTIKNNIIYDYDSASDVGVNFSGSAPTCESYNNTIINCTTGVKTRAVNLIRNTIFQDCGTDISGTANASDDYNLTDNVSIPGANSVTSSTLTFENKAADNFALAAGDTDAIGAGIGPSSDSDVPVVDIVGEVRSGTTTDIGAFMFVSAGGGGRIMSSLANGGGLAGLGGIAGAGGGLAG